MRAAKSDANQPEIVKALRQVGAIVTDTHRNGDGFPDIAVLYRGYVHVIEIKMPGGTLTKAEKKWHSLWGDSEFVHIVYSVDGALAAIGATLANPT